MPVSEKQKERIFNLPNLLTFTRLIMIPVFLYFFFYGPGFPVWALLIVAFLTDFLDGQIARKLDKVTQFGIFFDPLVDRLFIFSVLIAYFLKGTLSLIMVLPVLARDLLVMIGYLFLKARKISLSVSLTGKIATFLIFSSLVMIISPGMKGPGLYLYILGALIYLYSAFDYFLDARTAWKRENVSRETKFFGAQEVK